VSTEVIYSVIFAVILLGERVGVRLEVGTALVFVGALIIEGRRSAGKRSGNFLFGYETAIIAGFLFGVAPILIRYGLDAFPYYLPALFITFTSATVFYSVTVRPKAVVTRLYKSMNGVIAAFLVIGILTITTQLLIFTSLLYAPVVFFAPMLSTYPLFTIIFTRIRAKQHEVFGLRTLLSALLVVAGAMLVSLAAV
ncbi:MAG: EamA family transporter, partial [Thaumarchaeota archaeon]|nr:EamA family transporter [Nitrososphaerota archaeon]